MSKILNVDGNQIAVAGQRFFFDEYKFTDIPAGEEREANITGNFLIVLEATNRFQLGFDANRFIDSDLGLKYFLVGDDLFKTIRIKNTSSEDLSVTLNSGYGNIEDARLNVVQDRLVSIQNIREAPTTIISSTVTSIANGASEVFDGTPPTGQDRRQAIVITNEDVNNELDISDGSNIGGKIFPEQNLQINTSDSVTIGNTSGASITCKIYEIWYPIP